MMHRPALFVIVLLGTGTAAFAAPTITLTPTSASLIPTRPLPTRVVGRAIVERTQAGPSFTRQWPGTYFETQFRGTTAYFRIGDGDVILHVSVDGRAVIKLVKPVPGLYQIDGLSVGKHRVRVAVASENQAAPTTFGGFFAPPKTIALPLDTPKRQIEFIGDSHTVGYGNTSATRSCSDDKVWETTDTVQGIAPRVAAAFDADYQVNAISGRGVVRNYNGMAGDTLPVAYPHPLFGTPIPLRSDGWAPDVIVIALGTNDFSTPLRPGEPWTTRDALHQDYESTYLRFLDQLRAANPRAFILLWATDLANGEIRREASEVARRKQARGDTRIAFVPIEGLTFSACNSHPSLDDDQKISAAIVASIRSATSNGSGHSVATQHHRSHASE